MYLSSVLHRTTFHSTQQNRQTGERTNIHLTILSNITFESIARLFRGYYFENLKLIDILLNKICFDFSGIRTSDVGISG